MSSSNDIPLLRPKPRRPFELNGSAPTTPNQDTSSSPTGMNTPIDLPTLSSFFDHKLLSSPAGISTPSGIPKRTKSSIALTASTLFGIYSNNDETEPPTPAALSRNNSMLNVYESDFMNGASYQSQSKPTRGKQRVHHRRGPKPSFFAVAFRLVALLVFGVGYGVVVSHLHNTKTFTPSWWEEIESFSPMFLLGWGLAGVFLGSLLPWIDFVWDQEMVEEREKDEESGWMRMVRNVGSFVGIAYAIRKLPWQSTLQLSLTLAIANPWLWYLIDRTRAGFWLSAFVGVTGTLILFQTNPNLIEAPETHNAGLSDTLVAGLVSQETIGIWAWICSVLFCSSVCFGNVGRLLAFKEKNM